ncbi:hypothetical protein L1987_64023 [Smallanthus sonchifolius]|uniref:Uncharacterized protein n=1 Tax=Smallanthus sonchifolius TaxID=185202 RepID=A0ACB9CEX2_9ASTR|nr:hypothetical protein L1987_64023 [Smallanthus sonchifolius]
MFFRNNENCHVDIGEQCSRHALLYKSLKNLRDEILKHHTDFMVKSYWPLDLTLTVMNSQGTARNRGKVRIEQISILQAQNLLYLYGQKKAD